MNKVKVRKRKKIHQWEENKWSVAEERVLS